MANVQNIDLKLAMLWDLSIPEPQPIPEPQEDYIIFRRRQGDTKTTLVAGEFSISFDNQPVMQRNSQILTGMEDNHPTFRYTSPQRPLDLEHPVDIEDRLMDVIVKYGDDILTMRNCLVEYSMNEATGYDIHGVVYGDTITGEIL